jgi:hypothetical protein
MEQSPSWLAKRSLFSQEFADLLWKWQVHNCIYNSLQSVPVLSRMHLVHTPSHLLKIRFSIIPLSTVRFSK